jgi:hypothetical protein
LPGVVVLVVVVWLPWPDDEPEEPDPVAELVPLAVPVPLDFVCPGEDWLIVRPGPEPVA